jgi:abortive infection bacteriophage resistance protein
MIYTKPSIDIKQQVSQLITRGLIIKDTSLAERYLSNISYYRLAGYWWPMQSNNIVHTFKPNSTFENVIAIYNFDQELRILLFDVIEKIEIGFRTRLIHHLAEEISPWWFEDVSNFKDPDNHVEILGAIDKELLKTKEVFIKEHYKKYDTDTRRPPCWKTLEIASFGNNSKLYSNLLPSIKAKDLIAKELGTVNHTFLPSWLQSINQIRNLCAHHSRLWNKNLPGRPRLLPKPPNEWLKNVPPVNEHHMLYVHLCCMKYLLNRIHPGNQFATKLSDLLSKYPNIDPNALGLKPNWEYEQLWQR